MKVSFRKLLMFGILLSIVLGVYYLYKERIYDTSPMVNLTVDGATPQNNPIMDRQENGKAPADKLDAMTPEEKRKYYKTLLREKCSREMVRNNKFPLQDFYLLLDKGLVDTDLGIQLYSTAILRQYSIYHPEDVSIYMRDAPFREDAILALLDSDSSGVAENAFAILASTRIENEAIFTKLINAINTRQDDDMSKLEMIRELGRHENKHSVQIKQALVNLVLEYEIGSSGAAPMIDAALILSRYESERPDSIFPSICKAYEAELYDSSTLLNVFDNYASAGIGCADEMERVIDKIRRKTINFRQPSHAKYFLDKSQQVINKIRAN